jgi:hypothetical protein
LQTSCVVARDHAAFPSCNCSRIAARERAESVSACVDIDF